MPIVVQPVVLEDFDVLAKQAYFGEGDLIAPLLDTTWTVQEGTPESDAAALSRTQWSSGQQKRMFLHDRSARFLKAVDTDNNNEMLAFARWHFYEKGWPNTPGDIHMEHNGLTEEESEASWPEGLNVQLYKFLLDPLLYGRSKWTAPGPQWFLTTLKTRSGHRRKGAGGLLVAWGVEQAIKDGVPAYIEASELGEPVYRRCGFKVVGEHPIDLNEIGIPHQMVLKLMAANLDAPASK